MKSRRSIRSTLSVASVAFLFVVLVAQRGGQAAAGDALPYSKGFLVTGNYVVGGVDLRDPDSPTANGLVSGNIQITGVPAGADIIAAYLIWETITPTSDESQAAGVKFRGVDVDVTNPLLVKKTTVALTGPTASCWSSATPLSMHMFRADVLRLLETEVDKDDNPTGRRLANGSHPVALPSGPGTQIPESAGATLFVVYRNLADNLRKILLYDGLALQPAINIASLETLQGFYKTPSDKSARLTAIVGSGLGNPNDRLLFNNTVIASNPFPAGSAVQRGWANPTFDVTALMNLATNSSVYGETVTAKIDHQPATGAQDCLSLGTVIFSTTVKDIDKDGLPDGLEDAPAGLKDPDNTDLPNLNAMGANSGHKDLFVEFSSMWAAPGTSYGSVNAPIKPGTPTVTDLNGHHHRPTPEMLKMIGDTYAGRGVTPHFDVGDITSYHSLGVVNHTDWVDDYTSTAADGYLVPTALARGGEIIKEVACDVNDPECQFGDYPGTVGWKFGAEFLKESPVGDLGEELQAADLPAWFAGTVHRQRFDPARRGLFHFLLNVHARGRAKSPFPCLVNGLPAPFDSNNGTSCTTNNPDFHVPTSSSGVAELPGGMALVAHGLWEEFVGKPFVRASTTFHELGHNLNLWHGGVPGIFGSKALNTATYIEPNCKPNFLSSMSYVFQINGLFDNADQIHVDYSATTYSGLTETAPLTDVTLGASSPYRAAWFAPAGSALAVLQGGSAAKRFCGGLLFDPLNPPAPMARVQANLTTDAIDWNGDQLVNSSGPQDVNFDGQLTGPPKALNGYNDWANIRLNQIGAGKGAAQFSSGDILSFVDGDILSFADGDILSFADGDILSFADGDILSFADGDILSFADGDILSFVDGDIYQSLTFEDAKALGGSAPFGLTACVIGQDVGCSNPPPDNAPFHRIKLRWNPSNVGTPVYEIQRKEGNAASSNPFTLIGTSSNRFFVDTTVLPNGVEFTYRVRARFVEGEVVTFSAWSRTATVTAVSP